jgi:guanylate kinase
MNKIILCGKSGSGKDHMRKKLESRGYIYGISYTTRPARAGEINGKDYFFINKDSFEPTFWYSYEEFNNWYYGISKVQFLHQCNLFIMTPNAISTIDADQRKKCTIIYLDIDKNLRASRMSQRQGNADSIQRRLNADEQDFKHFTNYDIKITNPDF